MPMSKWRGGPPGRKWPCTTFRWHHAVTFKSKEEAVIYLDKYFFKYGDRMNEWTPIKVETLKRQQKKKPIVQLRTGLVLHVFD